VVLCRRSRVCGGSASPCGEASNHVKLRWLKTVVVSVGKAHGMGQVGIGKASVSEPLMTCREVEVTSNRTDRLWFGMSLAVDRLLARWWCPV
jgi:hypothetical protein